MKLSCSYFSLFSSLVTFGLTRAHDDHHHHDHHNHHGEDEMCSFETPSPEDEYVELARLEGSRRIDALQHRHSQRRALLSDEPCQQCINIDVYFHLISAFSPGFGSFIPHPQDEVDRFIAGDTSLLPEEFSSKEEIIELIKENMIVLNKAFADTPFYFRFVEDEVSLTANTEWTVYAKSYYPNMSAELGHADLLKMDVFVNYRLLTTDGEGTSTLGFAVLPFVQLEGKGDGVFVRYDGLTGGGNWKNDLGYTLVHEAGHWLGLYHTFNAIDPDVKCDPDDPNDFVDDTAAQSGPTAATVWDCTYYLDDSVEPLNSCPHLDGFDATFNYLNYLDQDYCWEVKGNFTPGQVERMTRHYQLFRQHKTSCEDEDDMEIEVVITFDEDHATENKIILQDANGSVVFDSDADHRGGLAFVFQKTMFFDLCVPRTDAYSLTVLDSANDGFSNGKIHVYRNRELLEVVQGGKFFHQKIVIPPASIPFAVTVPPALNELIGSRLG